MNEIHADRETPKEIVSSEESRDYCEDEEGCLIGIQEYSVSSTAAGILHNRACRSSFEEDCQFLDC